VPESFMVEMERLVPSAAAAYKQAVRDLEAERDSYRGPANELRQALWAVLVTLAPDASVKAETDYQQEPGTTGPTHKQRARYILRVRRGPHADAAVLAAVDTVAVLARETYQRANVSTHNERDREEALQIKRYVEVVLRDLLG
jgi:hypothetical protein